MPWKECSGLAYNRAAMKYILAVDQIQAFATQVEDMCIEKEALRSRLIDSGVISRAALMERLLSSDSLFQSYFAGE